MKSLSAIEPIDYLVIGHVTQDLTSNGPLLGGTVSYSALTARALGMRVGIVTACRPDLEMPELEGIKVIAHPSETNTTFENIYTPQGRVQFLHHQATLLDFSMIPEAWRNTPIVHLGPVAREVDPKLVDVFPNSLVGLTVQGWLRTWDNQCRVHYDDWKEAPEMLPKASAVVIGIEDVEGDESRIEEFIAYSRLLVVTEGPAGARLYWNGDIRRFRPPQKEELDATGAGDIFATVFFIRYLATRDPWEAARCATLIAANSVTRKGLQAVPRAGEMDPCLYQVVF